MVCPYITLQEVWLLKRELARGAELAVLDAFQCAEFDGTTLTATPAWGGPFAVDVVACVAEPSGGTFWIKAQNRSVQVCTSDLDFVVGPPLSCHCVVLPRLCSGLPAR